ncbi:MAG: hypothetical protein RLZZ29_1009 [Cyanobacteriota bacterium]
MKRCLLFFYSCGLFRLDVSFSYIPTLTSSQHLRWDFAVEGVVQKFFLWTEYCFYVLLGGSSTLTMIYHLIAAHCLVFSVRLT